MSKEIIRVGILGQGRSGWGIHAHMLRSMPERYRIVAVCDQLPDRAAQAGKELGCRSYTRAPELFADPEIDLAVVASYNNFHKLHAIQALEAGKHVLCDKPFGLTVEDVDAMTDTARRVGKLIAPFQQRRFEEDFKKVQDVINSGVLGSIVHVRICWHDFKRRWDWQTTRAFAGGALNNNGPHPLDHALCLFGETEPEVWAQLGRYLVSGDAEDHLKVILSAKGAPTVEIELTDVWAYKQDRWTVAGTRGGLRGNETRLDWKWVDFDTMPPRPLSLESTPDRSYNSEKLEWQSGVWEKPASDGTAGGAGAAPADGPIREFYQIFHESLTRGAPLPVGTDEVRRRIAVMEKIRAFA